MALQDDAKALIAAAEAVDTATATLRPLLVDLAAAEQRVRKAILDNGLPSRDHRADATQLRGLAISLLTGTSELTGTPLASIVTGTYGDLTSQGGAT
jgi:hypothetical protein